jgi:hypothetical protein
MPSADTLRPGPATAELLNASSSQDSPEMSGGKGRGKQSRDEAAKDTLVARPGSTDPLLTTRKGTTNSQITDALRQGLPHLTDPVSLQDSRAGKQPEGTGTTEEDKQFAVQEKRTYTTKQATQTQPALLVVEGFASVLGALPPDDWSRTWTDGRTIMLRRTSKTVKELVDKMCLPAVVRLNRRFWGDTHNGTAVEKLQVVMRQLTALTAQCRISTLELPRCDMKENDEEILAGVLA